MSSLSMEYSIDVDRGLVLVDYLENAGYDEWASVMESILADPAYRPGFGFLVDRRRADAVTTPDLQRMVSFIGDRRAGFEGSHWAIVVASLTDYGMARMTQGMTDDHPTTLQVFSDRRDAIQWLLDSGATDTG